MEQYEVYAECGGRSIATAKRFLDSFVPQRREVAEDYPFPELSESPRLVFNDADSLLRQLEEEPTEEYAVYWNRDGRGDPHQAMLFFTKDGGMIAGLASADPDSARILGVLASTVGATYGMVTLEERPPDTVREFRELCSATYAHRLVDGELIRQRPSPT